MNFSLGCAFTVDDVLMNFPYKKLSITCAECQKIVKEPHRQVLAARIFKECYRIVIEDIIHNNVTFWLPVRGARKCNIHMKKVEGKAFKNLRKAGKWKGVDFLKSFFCGYQLSFYMLGNRTPRVKSIYLNKYYNNIITDNTNKGMQYGDGKNDTTLNDYYEQIYQLFPEVPKSDIKRILIFSWKSLYLHNSYGGDVLISMPNFWSYIGNLRKDSLEHFFYYIRKLTVKLRVLYKRKHIEWDGYYYFALTKSQYQKYLEQKNKRGRPKRVFKFNSIYAYQIFDECKINEFYKPYIFRLSTGVPLKLKMFYRELITDKAELIITRDPLKFADILVYENKYDFL